MALHFADVAMDILDPPAMPSSIDKRRKKQRPPAWDWRVWLLHPGRRWGKGYTAARWIRDRVHLAKARSIALVGSTNTAVRQLMIEHPESGLLAVDPSARYYSAKGEVHWPNGAVAYVMSTEHPDRPPLRGGGFDTGWADEADSWGDETTSKKAKKAWENLSLSMSAGDSKLVVTSTPKAGRIVSELLERAKEDKDVAVTTGSTYENAANLSPQYVSTIERRFKGTTLEQREIHGQVPEAVTGALWTPDSFRYRKAKAGQLERVIVGVDPSGGGDEIGIVAAGQLKAERWIVLDDWTTVGSPAKWARKVKELHDKWKGDAVVAERNFGGDMVLSTLKNAAADLPVRMVTASRGKHIRAEPVSLLYESKQVQHRRGGDAELDLLEEELRHMTTTGFEGEGSPNRADAAVWALTELSKPRKTWGVA
ncbi:MAG: DNA-packaging protein [Proteobacteria bacterium]|nr:DNA-packaging protein [Pseudomonadota bacterium]